MGAEEWNDRYATGELPWDVGEPDEHLMRFLAGGTVSAGRALDVGCGTGTNVVWLAGRGFEATGIDVSSLAIERAKTKAAEAKARCAFFHLDFLEQNVPGGPFDLVFDRGCFHVFDEAEQRARFAERVARLLAPDGVWLSLLGSTEGAPREEGPPRRSARDIVAAVEPALELVSLEGQVFHTKQPMPARAWTLLARRRQVAAQPSTRR
jgi:SAM-dependent methyltransferase